MKRLLAVFAHPDDEGAISGTLAHYAGQGVHVALVCATKGEAGEISDPSLATPENLGEVRETELRCACQVIGIAELHLLGYCDSGMDGTPENEKVTAFIQAEPDEIRFKLVKLIREIKPHVLITFEPNGWYGHPDHIATGRYASEAYYLASDPGAFPGAGPIWQPDRLFHSAFPLSRFKVMIDYAQEHGIDVGALDSVPMEGPDPIEEQITHSLDVRDYLETKLAATRCHQTQFGEDSLFRQIPPEIQQASMGDETFIQVDPQPEPISAPISDLFTGVEGRSA
ncbi:MAG: PIG-L family deacetylase [Chloroflexota bacterium]|jgi:LmbE family N-acetylglucosaminyl deacetylase